MGADTPAADADYLPTMLGSAMAGMLARVPVHPIDTLKARIQVMAALAPSSTPSSAPTSTPSSTPTPTPTPTRTPKPTLPSVLIHTLRTEGPLALYRGFPFTFLGSAPASILYFTSYELSKDSLQAAFPSLPLPVTYFTAGIVAESLSCVLWVPIDVVKERMQVQVRPSSAGSPATTYYATTLDALRQISRTEGLAGLYRGYVATIASFGPFSALYFTFYEIFKARAFRHIASSSDTSSSSLASSSSSSSTPSSTPSSSSSTTTPPPTLLPLPYQIFTACTAGAIAAWITSPLDMVKLRLQVQRGASSEAGAGGGSGTGGLAFRYRGVRDGLRQIIRTEGFPALFRGSLARVLFHAPMTALSMSLFERCKDAAGRWVG
ncbi:mitochondrial carrier [Gonapodya prolifera JEL478]|uniref:Mitochondrial carrier n=1 Tax=Gonapodya prolifera (strain JEL478) TaxID=1344416 RepID=A0A139AN70_GONPJ|nr:mitochondrial carrier [Gonapodya prolifera JEL478]|eukprot:KXS18084.1 mitochondrial carrier [Gonapodya prolifera JEL478]